ncbi:MAG: hypothetical protein JW963_03425 [Anaerolineales bacterium]|nr:hypothetical protein [Anaerolineales bacterium]
MKTLRKLLPLILVAFLLSACGGNADATATEAIVISDVYTAAAMTLTAQASVATATITPLPTSTLTLWASPTSIPSATPILQSASVSYSTANGCYNSAYVSDVTIPDGTILAPGEAFTKTWKFQNSGTCDWDADFVLTFETGTDMDGEETVIDETVTAGETTSLSVALVAPETAGSYTGYWRLSTASGDAFGQSVFVLIVVSDDAATVTPTSTATAEEISATNTPTFTPIPSITPTDTPVPSTEELSGSTEQGTSTPETET